MHKNTDNRALRGVRVLLLVGGSLMILLAFLTDRLGYGTAGSLGIGQVLLALLGLLLLLAGLLGRRFLNLYRDAATLLLNTVVLFALIELSAIVIGRFSFQARHTDIQELPYYAAQDWTASYWQEADQTQIYRYEPYVIWRPLPYSGQLVNIDQRGLRYTPGADCGADAYQVLTFGGSTMMGWGAPDWGTIPAYLQNEFETFVNRPVCVINMATDGHVSTQGVVALMLQLQSGSVPDLVIFYDGVNEITAAHESGQPSVHVTLSQIVARFEEREPPLVTWARSTRTYTLLERLLYRPGQQPLWFAARPAGDTTSPDLADAVAEVYLGNYKIVEALAQEYGFDYFFFLQPHPAVGEKVLTAEEQMLRARMDPALVELARAFYEHVAVAAGEYEQLWNLAHVLDQEESQIWFDEVGHITPEGNRLVAREMIAVIEQEVAGE